MVKNKFLCVLVIVFVGSFLDMKNGWCVLSFVLVVRVCGCRHSDSATISPELFISLVSSRVSFKLSVGEKSVHVSMCVAA